MNNKQILTLVFIVFAMFSLSRIRFLDNHVEMGNELEVHTSIVNDVTTGNQYQKQEEVRVVAYIPELGEVINSPRFDIDKHDSYSKMMWWGANAPAGDYLVRITASNDDFSARKFRYITVE